MTASEPRTVTRTSIVGSLLWNWLPVLLVVGLAGGNLSPAKGQTAQKQPGSPMAANGAPDERSTLIAILLGNNIYNGKGALQPLEYADNDVARFARAIRPLTHLKDMYLLWQPDEEATREAHALGLTRWQAPTRANLISTLAEVQVSIRALRESEKEGAEVRVLLFVSAHGDDLGVHLEDGILSGATLQTSLSMLAAADSSSADSVLLVADSCFSDYWLGLKGVTADQTAAVDINIGDISRAVSDLERLGAVTAQSFTREDRTLLRGGQVTYLMSAALMGLADLDQDGQVLYSEAEAFIRTYSQHSGDIDRVKVRPPRQAPEWPPVMVDLKALEPRGLFFPPETSGGSACYWIRTQSLQLMGEFCKESRQSRRFYLPPGTYTVLRRSPPDRLYGREGTVGLEEGFVTVNDELLSGYWLAPVKGGQEESDGGVQSARGRARGATPVGSRPLEDIEWRYLSTSPVQRPVGWKQEAGRARASLRLGASLAGKALEEGVPSVYPEVSLTEERPGMLLAGVVDVRMARLGRNYLLLGAKLDGTWSWGNAVGATDDATVLSTAYRLRLGWEHPSGRNTVAVALEAGGISATPFSSGTAPVDEDYRLRLGVSGGLEGAYCRVLRPGFELEVAVAPLLILEPQLLGPLDQDVPVWVPYLGWQTVIGARF